MSREQDPREWLRFADSDRRAAHALLEAGFYEQCAFHCQQAVEKLLKAIIVKQTRSRPVHTHDLNALMERVTSAAISEPIARAISDIDGYYAGSRYPIDVVDEGAFSRPLAESACNSRMRSSNGF